jgi:hypothetical protein
LHAINFLTAVSRSVHYQLFKDPTALRQICESIVIPNLKMRDDMVRPYGSGRGCLACLALSVLELPAACIGKSEAGT